MWRPYLSGIFKSVNDADNYLNQYPDDIKENTSKESITLEYPFFITEDHNGFTYLNENEVIALMKNFELNMVEDDDYCYTNLYLVEEDYFCKKPGKDYMGIIQHWHIQNSSLKQIKQCGLESLWS